MKYPAGLIEPDGDVVSFGELKSYLRAVRYDSALRWAQKRTRAELEHTVAALFAVRRPWAGKPTVNERRTKTTWFNIAMREKQTAERAPAKARVEVAKKGASAKLANDPVQAVKPEAFKLWQDWQTGTTLHKSGAAFHRFVVNNFPIITDTKTAERWCRAWAAGKK